MIRYNLPTIMKFFSALLMLFFTFTLSAQDAMQAQNFFISIPNYPTDYSAANIIQRLIDGVGYRYYWATKDLRAIDLNFRPEQGARSSYETVKHIYDLSQLIVNAATQTESHRPTGDLPTDFELIRKQTLENLYQSRMLFSNLTAEQLEQRQFVFQRGDNKTHFPLWHLFNGPAADALYHIGQLVSYRRSSGNPIDPKVNVFMGKNNN